jgi:hypothetical protein
MNAGDDRVAIKSGFTSGYGGQGPRTFSRVLQLLDSHGAEIQELVVSLEFIERIDRSALTFADLASVYGEGARRHARWRDYVDEDHWEAAKKGTLWSEEFPPLLPFALIDARIVDLALTFGNNPGANIITGFCRLEDIFRSRTGSEDHSAKLFDVAFAGGLESKLYWENVGAGEQGARLSLFKGVYMTYRNPRAHREMQSEAHELYSEFMMLNQLFLLESTAVARPERT